MPVFNQEKINKLKKIDKLFRSVYLFPKNKKAYPPLMQTDIKEILVIGFLLIGDTIMYIPALKILRKNFPDAKITIVGGQLVKTILEDQNIVDNFVIAQCPWISPFNKSFKNLLNFLLTIKVVNRSHYDFAIDFRGDWRNVFYLNFVKSKRKVSFDFSGGEYMLTDCIHVDHKIEHLIDETLTLLEKLNCSFDINDKYPNLNLTPTDREYMNYYETQVDLKDKFVIGIHPGASLEERKWNEEKYGELVVRIAQKEKEHFFLLFEGPNESESINKIRKILESNGIHFAVVKKNMHQYMVLMNCCKIIICNDSGAAHLAAAYNIPQVVIFGKGDPIEVKPYSRNISKIVSHELECKPCHMINCKYGTNLCMNLVTVDEVYDQVVDIVETVYC